MVVKKTHLSAIMSLIFCIMLMTNFVFSQNDSSTTNKLTANLGSDLVSRYVWRGMAWEESFCVQPTMSLTYSNLTLGVWGSYSIVKESMDECDIFLSYSIPTSSGLISAYLYDYHNPNFGGKFFNYKGDGEGSHVFELYLQFDGSEKFPITFLAGYNIHNDLDKSKYFEIGYKFSIEDINMNLFFGGTKGISDWYQVPEDKIAIISTGINASKKVKITNDFSPLMTLTYMLNAYIEKSFLVFKITL